jgi:hypothetical protein
MNIDVTVYEVGDLIEATKFYSWFLKTPIPPVDEKSPEVYFILRDNWRLRLVKGSGKPQGTTPRRKSDDPAADDKYLLDNGAARAVEIAPNSNIEYTDPWGNPIVLMM